MSHIDEVRAQLLKVAENHSRAFCYTCYQTAPSGRCAACGSDDLMREVPGVGVEYGSDWVAEYLVGDKLTAVDVDEAFDESVAEIYPETVKIGWIEYDVASAIKELDPVSWNLAKSEWIDGEVSDDLLMTFDNGSTYYRVADVERMIEELSEDS